MDFFFRKFKTMAWQQQQQQTEAKVERIENIIEYRFWQSAKETQIHFLSKILLQQNKQPDYSEQWQKVAYFMGFSCGAVPKRKPFYFYNL